MKNTGSPETDLALRFKSYFESYSLFQVRDHASLIEDRNYRAAYSQEMYHFGFTDVEIAQGIKEGWLKKQQIRIEGVIRNVLLYLPAPTSQRGYKLFLRAPWAWLKLMIAELRIRWRHVFR